MKRLLALLATVAAASMMAACGSIPIHRTDRPRGQGSKPV